MPASSCSRPSWVPCRTSPSTHVRKVALASRQKGCAFHLVDSCHGMMMVMVMIPCAHVSGGKRRPFIFWAVLAALLGALTFPNAEYIGYWLGDRRGFQPCGIATAVLSLVVSAPGSKG